MRDEELRRRLARVELAGEDEARERTWLVVRAAFAERDPVARPRRRARPFLVLAAAAALVAGALGAPGRAVLAEVREAIGVEESEPALFSLPAPGTLLVSSSAGPWIVRTDGSKRLLAGYREASWSPHGLFVAAAGRNELAALEPDGDVRWKLSRRDVSRPRWGGTRADTRIAYVTGRTLRVVAGDGTGDRVLSRRVARVAPAWRPRSPHVLAYVDAAGRLRVVEADSGRSVWRPRRVPAARRLEWSRDGTLLLVQGPRALLIVSARGLRLELRPRAARVRAAAFSPARPAVAFVQEARGRSELWVVPRLRPHASPARRVFSGAGTFTGVEWSPDGRWLLLAWRDADQWLFIRSAGVRRVEAVSGISDQFESATFPALAGWCCP